MTTLNEFDDTLDAIFIVLGVMPPGLNPIFRFRRPAPLPLLQRSGGNNVVLHTHPSVAPLLGMMLSSMCAGFGLDNWK